MSKRSIRRLVRLARALCASDEELLVEALRAQLANQEPPAGLSEEERQRVQEAASSIRSDVALALASVPEAPAQGASGPRELVEVETTLDADRGELDAWLGPVTAGQAKAQATGRPATSAELAEQRERERQAALQRARRRAQGGSDDR